MPSREESDRFIRAAVAAGRIPADPKAKARLRYRYHHDPEAVAAEFAADPEDYPAEWLPEVGRPADRPRVSGDNEQRPLLLGGSDS